MLGLLRSSYVGGVFCIEQSKTGATVEIPPTTELRERLDRYKADSTHFIVNENTSQPYRGDTFTHDFLKVRRELAKTMPEVMDLWYLDLRRTCVVWMAESGATIPYIGAVTGQSPRTVHSIIETYMPATPKMAAAAIELLSERRAKRARKGTDGEPS